MTESTTQQRHADLEHLYQQIPTGLALLDTQLRFVRINQRLAEMHGAAIHEHLGRTPGEVLPELAESVEPLFRQVLETGEPILDFEVRVAPPVKPHQWQTWAVSAYLARGEVGTILGINAVVQDITARKSAERRVIELNQDLERRLAEIRRHR